MANPADGDRCSIRGEYRAAVVGVVVPFWVAFRWHRSAMLGRYARECGGWCWCHDSDPLAAMARSLGPAGVWVVDRPSKWRIEIIFPGAIHGVVDRYADLDLGRVADPMAHEDAAWVFAALRAGQGRSENGSAAASPLTRGNSLHAQSVAARGGSPKGCPRRDT